MTCSIRRAIPYPCSGPSVSSVLRIIKARVPCQISVLVDTLFSYGLAIGEYNDSYGKTRGEAVSWNGSAQGAVATWSNHGVKFTKKYRVLNTDQVATAPCTDPFQDRFPIS